METGKPGETIFDQDADNDDQLTNQSNTHTKTLLIRKDVLFLFDNVRKHVASKLKVVPHSSYNPHFFVIFQMIT